MPDFSRFSDFSNFMKSEKVVFDSPRLHQTKALLSGLLLFHVKQ